MEPQANACLVISDGLDSAPPTSSSHTLPARNRRAPNRPRELSAKQRISTFLESLSEHRPDSVHKCPHPLCDRFFSSHAHLTLHQKAGNCSVGLLARPAKRPATASSYQSPEAFFRQAGAESRRAFGFQNQVDNCTLEGLLSSLPSRSPAQVPAGTDTTGAAAVTAIPFFAANCGWAHKPVQKKGKRSSKQLRFLRACYMQGVHQKRAQTDRTGCSRVDGTTWDPISV